MEKKKKYQEQKKILQIIVETNRMIPLRVILHRTVNSLKQEIAANGSCGQYYYW